MINLSILTYNVGLLRVTMLGKLLAEPAPFIEERFRAIPSMIKTLDADIVALQEVYFDHQRDFLVESLLDQYPHVVRFDRKIWPNLGNGLLLLAKSKISCCKYIYFRDVDFLERIFVGKGAIVAVVELPHFGPCAIGSAHATAGGSVHPESEKANRARSKNIKTVIGALRSLDSRCRILVGDLNAGPEASRVNYEEVLKHGFRDSVGVSLKDEVTWDPKNPLNSSGPDSDCPPQRIDHILFDLNSEVIASLNRAEIIFKEPVVVTDGGAVTASDHYGLVATVSLEEKS